MCTRRENGNSRNNVIPNTVQTEDKRHAIKMLRSATVEGHYRLRPANQFHHLATVHMLSRERNGQQAQRALDNEQRQDQDIRSGSRCTHA